MAVLEELERFSDQRFLSLYEALSEKGFGPLDAEVAKKLKFRPQAIQKLPFEKRAQQAKLILLRDSNAEMCYELFGSYLMRDRKELITAFLDATGVAHDDGMLEDVEKTPDAKKIAPAVQALDEKFDAQDVTLYLALCVEQWPGAAELRDLWEKRSPS